MEVYSIDMLLQTMLTCRPPATSSLPWAAAEAWAHRGPIGVPFSRAIARHFTDESSSAGVGSAVGAFVGRGVGSLVGRFVGYLLGAFAAARNSGVAAAAPM